jgi:SAM-dependent methyltransferase
MPTFEIPAAFNRSAAHLRDADAAEASAVFLIRHTCESLGVSDLADREVLDVGCGTKFTQAFLNHRIPIQKYVGVDVFREMITFLRENVADPRFEYSHVDVRNELYNPDAPPMSENTDLGIGTQTFDIIWLFSVFTHLAPRDYRAMLKLLRRYIRPDGRLFFTVFIDELTADGFGFTDKMNRALQAADSNAWLDRVDGDARREVKPFLDVYPDQPLRCALYSRNHAFELIEGTGWTPLALLPPNQYAQHQFVCAPD